MGVHKQDAYATALNNVKINYSVIHDLTKNTYTYKVLVGNQGPSSSEGIQRFILDGTFGDILYLGGPEPSGWNGYDPTQPDFSTSASSSYIYPVNWDTFYFQGTQLDTSPAQAHVEFYDGTNGAQWLTTQTSCGSGDVAESCQVTCVAEGSEGIQSTVTCPVQPSSQPAVNEGSNPNPVITTLNSNSSVTVQTDKSNYIVGDKITISGSASPVSGNPVTIRVLDPSNNVIRIFSLPLTSSGIYGWPLWITVPPFDNPGTYTIEASYQGANTQTTLTFVNNSPTSTSCPPDYALVNGQCVVGTAPSQNQPTQPSQGNYTITVSTDKSSYILGDMVKISGTGSPLTNSPVAIQVLDPSNKLVDIYPAAPTVYLYLKPSGTYFTQTGVTTPPFEMNGVYTLKATYQGASAQTTFSVTNAQSAISSTPQSCPGTVFPNGQCVIYSGGRCIDEYGNAITGGVTIQNNQCIYTTQASNDSAGNQTAQVIISQGSGEPGSTCASSSSCLQPTILTVNQGTTVTWLNNDVVDHTITSGKPTDALTGTIFDSALFTNGKIFSFTFNNPGTFYYFDQVHPWIIGQIIVESSGTIGTTTHAIVIPSWIKNTAKWWSEGQVSDDEFVKAMQYLINNGMMQIQQNLRLVDNNGKELGLVDNNGKNLGLTEKAQLGGANTTTGSNVTSQGQIPSWVKNNAKWWAAGQLSDDEFVKAMQYLINNGMMHIEQNAGLVDNNGKHLGVTHQPQMNQKQKRKKLEILLG